MPVDTRKVVGGSVFAKADAVSHNCKRIFGAGLKSKWLRGIVLECLSLTKDGNKRATTYIKARFIIAEGTNEVEKILPLSSLKDHDPTLAAQEAAAAAESPTNRPPPSVNVGDVPPTPSTLGTEGTGGAGPTITAPTTAPAVSDDSSSIRTLPVASVNERDWFEGEVEAEINGPVANRFWRLSDQHTGAIYTPNIDPKPTLFNRSDHSYRFEPIDCFMAVFPKEQMKLMIKETNNVLQVNGLPLLTMGELLKWMGICILITRFEFGNRADLWADSNPSKYVPPARFGSVTGMSRRRFDLLWQFMVWSKQPSSRPESMSHETYSWKLVDDFVNNINEHRKCFFSNSYRICVDESIFRWYGLGGSWINTGLPMYVAIQRKPEDGCEVQNAACGLCGIMMQLRIVKSAQHEQEEYVANKVNAPLVAATSTINSLSC